jgi:hypothetical protein
VTLLLSPNVTLWVAFYAEDGYQRLTQAECWEIYALEGQMRKRKTNKISINQTNQCNHSCSINVYRDNINVVTTRSSQIKEIKEKSSTRSGKCRVI